MRVFGIYLVATSAIVLYNSIRALNRALGPDYSGRSPINIQPMTGEHTMAFDISRSLGPETGAVGASVACAAACTDVRHCRGTGGVSRGCASQKPETASVRVAAGRAVCHGIENPYGLAAVGPANDRVCRKKGAIIRTLRQETFRGMIAERPRCGADMIAIQTGSGEARFVHCR